MTPTSCSGKAVGSNAGSTHSNRYGLASGAAARAHSTASSKLHRHHDAGPTRRPRRRGITLALACDIDQVRDIIERTDDGPAIPVYPTVQAAADVLTTSS
jgi:hypothetical protein